MGSKIAWTLLFIGGINWGLVGIGMLAGGKNWNVVNLIEGSISWLEAVIYLLVGLSALMVCVGCKCKKCKAAKCAACEGGNCAAHGKGMNEGPDEGMAGEGEGMM